jgi:hypothetical protein
MPAAMRPYSIAVAPDWFLMKAAIILRIPSSLDFLSMCLDRRRPAAHTIATLTANFYKDVNASE